MCGAQQGALIGMVLYEGWASTPGAARSLLERGEILLESNHPHGAVGPMAGTISPSAPVWVVENRAFGNRAYCRQVEGRVQFGDYSDEALDGLRRWRDVWAPTLREALHHIGGLQLDPIIIQALQMGDELHNRHSASSSLFANQMAVAISKADIPRDRALPTLGYLAGHNLLFLGLAMACGKAIADAARDVEYSSLVVAMCRNGTEFGIQVSGLEGEWFVAPSPAVEGLYLPGFSAADAGLDMGDSAITETVGWGAFTLAGAPGILPLVGGTPGDALAFTQEMRRITTATHPTHRMPALGFEGTSVGIDIRKVVQTGIAPYDRYRHRPSGGRSSDHRGGPGAGADGVLQACLEGLRRTVRTVSEVRRAPAAAPVMPSGYVIRKDQYYDSVFLMGVNSRLSKAPGVRQTAVLMGSERNKALLEDLGIRAEAIDAADADDLVIAVLADDEQAVHAALEGVDAALLAVEATVTPSEVHTLQDGLRLQPEANLAVLTIPGDYVYPEARKALEAGLHVFIFSSNVPLEQERELKQLARQRGLLVMGPDCGTSILGGVGSDSPTPCAGGRSGSSALRAPAFRSSPVRSTTRVAGLARHRNGQPRPVERHRRDDDLIGSRGSRARPVDRGDRPRRQTGRGTDTRDRSPPACRPVPSRWWRACWE